MKSCRINLHFSPEPLSWRTRKLISPEGGSSPDAGKAVRPGVLRVRGLQEDETE